MPLKPAAHVSAYLSAFLDKCPKLPQMAAEILSVHASQADIEKPSLPEEPAVTFHVPAEKELRRIAGNAAHFADFCSQKASHRAMMSASAHQEPGPDVAVDDPVAVIPFQH